jgi:hypothetical protein
MFREDVEKAQAKFDQALGACIHGGPSGTFGNDREMFASLLATSLELYGDKGLVDQEVLANTDFLSAPHELVKTVRDGVAHADPQVKLLGDLTAHWMEMMIDQHKMPLTPHHTQVLAMLMFSQFYNRQSQLSKPVSEGGYNFNAVIMQMKTGEGKSIVIAMLAIFVVKKIGKRVHVLENNQGLLERDYATYKPFYDRFNLSTSKTIDESSHICYCLKKENNKFFNEHLIRGSVNLDDVVLIVDEVDDLVVNESPTVSYVKEDVEKSPQYLSGYEALIRGSSDRPGDCPNDVWKDCKRIKEVAETKRPGEDYVLGTVSDEDQRQCWLMLEKREGELPRVPKVKLTDDWLEYLNLKDYRIPAVKRVRARRQARPCLLYLLHDFWPACVAHVLCACVRVHLCQRATDVLQHSVHALHVHQVSIDLWPHGLRWRSRRAHLHQGDVPRGRL